MRENETFQFPEGGESYSNQKNTEREFGKQSILASAREYIKTLNERNVMTHSVLEPQPIKVTEAMQRLEDRHWAEQEIIMRGVAFLAGLSKASPNLRFANESVLIDEVANQVDIPREFSHSAVRSAEERQLIRINAKTGEVSFYKN